MTSLNIINLMTTPAYESLKSREGVEYCQLSEHVAKSANDKRTYCHLKLNNDLQVLLISDPEADKSAAALDVFVGSQNDPKELPGLAHFCEHLLFMGTEKYPKENEYSEYLSENAGYSNAFTSYDHTNYYFEVGTDHLEGALDRFAQFFISSLFSPSCTEKEINAVDSENKKNLQSDNWRIYQLQKSMSRSDHPFSSFSTGNLDTLLNVPKSKGIDTRDELLKFYSKYYSSNLMKLVVSGKESIEQLTQMVVPLFSLIENKQLAPPIFPGSPSNPDQNPYILYIEPVKDTRTLELQFEIPSQLVLYETKPAQYLSHLIGHEGVGSILSLLKKKSWVTELYSSASTNHSEFAIFEIGLELTPSGLEYINEITEMIFQYLHLLRLEGINEQVFDELKSLWDLNFRFQEKSNISNYVSRLAGLMQRPVPPSQVVSSPSLFTRFGPEEIRNTLDCLIPENLRMSLISKTVQSRKDLQQERWYGTNYSCQPIESEFLQKLKNVNLNPDLHLPKPNIFIPSDFNFVRTDLYTQQYPALLINSPLNTLWYHRGSFQVPKASLCMFIQNPYAYSSPRLFVCLELLKDIIIENLAEFGYDAQMSGLNYDIDVQYRGINVIVQGYNHKIELLLFEIIKHLVKPLICESVFSMCKEKMVRKLQNSKMNSPVSHASYYTSYSLLEKMWTNDEKLIDAPYITPEEIEIFSKDFFSRAHMETLVVGNISPEASIKLVNEVQNQFVFKPLLMSEKAPRRNIYLSAPSCSFVYSKSVSDPSNVNSAIEFYLDAFSYFDLESRVYSELIAHLISEPAFNQLRTIEQLGYIVFGGSRNLSSRGGIRILIQSEKDPIYLESRIENFLESFSEQVEKFSDKEFQARVNALITLKLKKDESLAQLARRDWDVISSSFYDFDTVEKAVEILKNATQKKTIEVIKNYVLKGSPMRRKFSLHLRSQKLPALDQGEFKLKDCGTTIEDLTAWKNSQFLSPAPAAILPIDSYYWDSSKNSTFERKSNL